MNIINTNTTTTTNKDQQAQALIDSIEQKLNQLLRKLKEANTHDD